MITEKLEMIESKIREEKGKEGEGVEDKVEK